MVVENLIDIIDPGKAIIICKEGEMLGLFPGRFIPSIYYKEHIQLITYAKEDEALKIYIGDRDE